MMRRSPAWSDDQDNELWRLYCLGVSEMRLSVRFRRSRRAIQVRVAALRKKFRTGASQEGTVSEQTRATL